MPPSDSRRSLRPALGAALTWLLALALLAPVPPAVAEYGGSAWSMETIYTASAGNFTPRDATLAQRPDGSYVEVFLTPDTDGTYPLTLLARAGGPGAWGPVEVVTDHEDDTTPYSIEAFAAPDGSVVAVWRVYLEGQSVFRSSTRAPGGGWSEPVVVGSGQVKAIRLLRGPVGATLAWTTAEDTLRSSTWSDGAWAPVITATGEFSEDYAEYYAWAVRESDGRVAVATVRDEGMYVSQLDPGGAWSDPVRTHPKISNCAVDVGVLDADGNIMALVTLCFQSVVTGNPGMTYDPEGDLHLWWNSWSGMNRVQGIYPNHQIVCDCSGGTSGTVAAGGDMAVLGSSELLPGLPRTTDGRSVHKVWDADGDKTTFIGGLGDYGRTINVYREGSTFGSPDATFQAPGSSQSSRVGYVVDTFVSGDDILVAYQHTAPASNLGPGGSCNTRLLRPDNTLSDPLGQCLDGNTDDATAVQAPDGTVAIASASVRYYYFSRFLVGEPSEPEPEPTPTPTPTPTPVPVPVPEPAPATIAITGSNPTYGAAGLVRVVVTGAGDPAAGSVRLRYAGATLATIALGGDGRADLPIGRTALPPGPRTVAVDYLGSNAVLPGSAQRVLAVGRATPKTAAVAVPKRPTSKKTGTVKVSLAAPSSGLARPTGKVELILRKGAVTKKQVRTLVHGVATITVPRLAKGTWRLTAHYRGDLRYLPRSSAQVTVKVRR